MNKNKYSLQGKIFISILIFIFFIINFKRINYGLPYFLNLDETAFLYSTLTYLNSITKSEIIFADPIYAPFFNLVLILKSVFINEFLIQNLNFSEIKSKIYFNPELFISYGRVASLTISSLSIFTLYLIFKKLKIDFFIYSTLLFIFCSSLVLIDISIINGKNSYYLFFFLIQLYFFIKYLVKIQQFNITSYLIFGILGSLAWGVNYWPAFISIYAVFILHFEKFKFNKINYLFLFLIIFIIFGPIINFIYSGDDIFKHLLDVKTERDIEFNLLLKNSIIDFISGLKIMFKSEYNFFLLIFFAPIYLIKKNTKNKKLFLIIFFILLEPLIIFALAQGVVPQLRYFAGSLSIVLILISIIANEFNRTKLKFLILIFFIANYYFIYNNIKVNHKLNNLISENHSFYRFNESINKIDQSKILYLIDLGFQENLKQNLLYLELYNNNIIKNSKRSNTFINGIKSKIEKIENTNNIVIQNKHLKNLVYYNYTFAEIDNLKLFFDYIKKDYDYIVIEDSDDVFYLSNYLIQKEIKDFVKENFELQQTQFSDEKIFLKSIRSVINYYGGVINVYDLRQYKTVNHNLEKIYGNNYSLYKLK
ncbi:hypothetical protein N9U27_02285 [Candidatus Pelagibacter sp.]|nr:hypothetical protein [Candidatus Pelagibacter sp.]